MIRLTFLGTGTSHGVPMIGCDCPVCRSPDPRNRRMRSSVIVRSDEGGAILADVSPEFRFQALANDIRRVDAVVLTHSHADHIMGMDDLRRINELQNGAVPIHGDEGVLRDIRRTFAYAFESGPPGPTRPSFDLRPFTGAPIEAPGLTATPLPCRHGPFAIHGFLFEGGGRKIGYFPDCNGLPEATQARLRGIDVMILDGLRPQGHPTHFSLSESVAMLQSIGARRSFITHLCHRLDHDETQRALPPGIEVPWDGLTVTP